jgi:hypothetical protein
VFSGALVCALAHVHALEPIETRRASKRSRATRLSTHRDYSSANLDSSSAVAEIIVKLLQQRIDTIEIDRHRRNSLSPEASEVARDPHIALIETPTRSAYASLRYSAIHKVAAWKALPQLEGVNLIAATQNTYLATGASTSRSVAPTKMRDAFTQALAPWTSMDAPATLPTARASRTISEKNSSPERAGRRGSRPPR